MTNQQAAQVLRDHNKWRRGTHDAHIPHSGQKLGQAIDLAVNSLEHTQIGGYDPDHIKPTSGKRVLVRVMYGTSGKPWTTVAAYIAKHTEKADSDSFEGVLDYDEETDEYYYPEGWYEHGLYAEVNYIITDTVLVWTYLPDDGIVIDEQAKVNADKAAKWDALSQKIAKFYEAGASTSFELGSIGEVAAHAFGYL